MGFLKGHSHLIKCWYITSICNHIMIGGDLTSWTTTTDPENEGTTALRQSFQAQRRSTSLCRGTAATLLHFPGLECHYVRKNSKGAAAPSFSGLVGVPEVRSLPIINLSDLMAQEWPQAAEGPYQ